MLKIKEIYPTIQCEGSLSGTPATFIRLSECNLSCEWEVDNKRHQCDTNFSGGIKMPITDIIQLVLSNPSKHVVITGGEPTIQLEGLYRLASELRSIECHVSLETNGTNKINIHYFDHVTISPKNKALMSNVSQEKNRTINQFECHDLKLLYTGQELWELEEYEKNFTVHKALWLQPLSNDDESIQQTIKTVMKYPHWKLSLQTHKMIGLQ